MSNSPQFAADVLACAALGILLWAACVGIGYRILPARPAARSDDEDGASPVLEPATWNQPGIAACAGLGALLLLGGVGVAVEIPWWLIVVPFVAAGLGLVVWEVSRVEFRHPASRSALVMGGLGVAAFALVAIVEAVPGLRFPLNACDDLRAYLPLAHRLIDTNGLVDPWNARRLQNLGGFTFLQAMPVAVFGDAGIGVVETVVASIFLAGIFVANGFRSTWARVLSVGFILAIPLLWVPRVNTTGVLIGSPLIVAALATTVELRKALRARELGAALRWAIAGGLIAGAVTSVRPNLGVLAGVFIALGALLASGAPIALRLRVLGAGAASAFIAIAPWSVASWRTVNTPFFALFTGNQNRAAVAHQSAHGLRDLVDQAFSLARAGPYLWISIGVLVVAVLARKMLPDAPFVIMAAAVTCVFIVGFAFVEYFASTVAIVRYIAPAAEGLAVFFVFETVRAVDARRVPRSAVEGHRWLPPALAVGAAIVLAAGAYSTLTVKNPFPLSGAHLVERARNPQRSHGSEVPRAVSGAYRRALAQVDPSRTIAAVDRPYLIDFRRDDIPNLDLPGFTTPDGTFPFFSGPVPKIARLRRAGFDTLIATVPATDACLNPSVLRSQIRQQVHAYDQPARFYLDWENDLAAIVARAPGAVHEIGPILVIDLPRAQRELAEQQRS
ncbi:MAG: hypothetical protein ACXVKA_02155 [Acidimicrobiia bacterium]